MAQSSALGLRGDALSALLDNLPIAPLSISSSVLTFLWYEQCSAGLYAEAHDDKGLLTAVFALGWGLQVREPAWEAKPVVLTLDVRVCILYCYPGQFLSGTSEGKVLHWCVARAHHQQLLHAHAPTMLAPALNA